MGMKKQNKGITLIALVITIIVLLILAVVTILALLGDNGIISKASQAKIKTLHENVYEEIELYANSYFLEKKENEFNGTLMEYFNRDESKLIIDENGIINVKNLLGSSQSLGNGTSIETGDVYALKEVDDDENKYEVVYYGKSETDVTSLGFVIDNGSSTSSDTLKYAYLFKVNSEGELTINPYYSYYSTKYVLISKNGYILQNMSFIIPSTIDGKV
jgi:type II secretory pathway pseudopilin PulG